jgi:hypothetical protein
MNKTNINENTIKKLLRSHVIYRVPCTCSSNYIGLTKRQLHVRLREHKSVTGVRFSSLAEHSVGSNHEIAWDDVEVLASDSDEFNLSYLETLLIAKFKPSLNNRQSSITLNLFSS